MYHRVKKFCKQHHMFAKGDKIVVGLSGGPDSICLLDMLCRMREEEELTITAVHIHHGIRGTTADRDEVFSKEYCEQRGVPYYCFHEAVEERAKQEKISVEEAGRLCRYEKMEEVRVNTGSDVIAVGHHKNDQAETILFHLVRGSGLEGLCGILPKRDIIIRPLLCMTREEILSYLSDNHLPYQIDETNLEMLYTRNKIRNQWIPMLEAVNKEAVSHIDKTASLLSEAVDFIKEERDKIYGNCVTEREDRFVIEREVLEKQHSYIQSEVLKKALTSFIEKKVGQGKTGGKDILSVHIEQLKQLFHGETGKELHLPKGILAKNTYGTVELCMNENDFVIKQPKNLFCYKILAEDLNIHKPIKEFELIELGHKIKFQIKELSAPLESEEKIAQIISKDTYKKMFDYDKIKGGLQLRTRMSSDKIIWNKKGQTKSLKRYFIDEKIPREERDRIPVLADEEGILWLIGYRIGEQYKVDTATRRILLVEYERKTKENKDG